MILILGVFVLIHVIAMMRLLFGWLSVVRVKSYNSDAKPIFISILIPMRNEEENINRILRSIYRNNYDRTKYEVIVIDDHSTDNTVEIATSAREQGLINNLLRLDAKHFGKKKAIASGVEAARGEIILITDADCEVPPNWIDHYSRYYSTNHSIQMIYGPVEYENLEGAFLKKMLNAELAGLVGIGASSLQLSKPTMINGANMSFKKAAFLDVAGYTGNEHIPTGDDEFLLRKVHQSWPDGVFFLKESEAVVQTETPRSPLEFFHQRRRWASKWKYHKDLASLVAPVYMALFSVFVIWGYTAIFSRELAIESMVLLGIKLTIEILFVSVIKYSLKLKTGFFSLVAVQIIYPFYVVFFAIASNFGSYHWKNRAYNILSPDDSKKA